VEIFGGREGKGREGKGRERKGREGNAITPLTNRQRGSLFAAIDDC
jgi:hypothetical protein